MRNFILSIVAVIVLGLAREAKAQATVPTIVYSTSLLGQTGGITSGTIYTTPEEGLYRLSGNTYNGSGSCSTQIFVEWAGQGVHTGNGANLSMGPGPTSDQSFVLPAGINLNYQISSGSCTYDAFIVIEKIG